uniref:WD_REPEATS_REGION domain-containing protein n=1 Tax=Steinernema glaseri TaxID=37863 RepID=A0A1I7ZHY6_9BILA
MTNSKPRFTLCDVGSAHIDDVKAIAKHAGGFASVGRDGCVFKWEPTQLNRFAYHPVTQLGVAANSVAVLKRHDGLENIFVGLSSGSIVCISPVTGIVCCTLEQHSANVCSLYVDQEARILISGSWDTTAIIWDIGGLYEGLVGDCERFVLQGHNQSVWAAKTGFVKNSFITGSADKTIKYWDRANVLKSMTAPDIVRAIELIGKDHVFGLLNSGSVGLWDLSSETMLTSYNTMSGEFMYSMKLLTMPNQEKCLVTCGEGGNVEVLKIDENDLLSPSETFQLPVGSIWSVQVLEDNKIVFGASDKNVYVYSLIEHVWTDPEIENIFQEKMKVIEKEKQDRIRKESADEVVTMKISFEDGGPMLDLHYRKGTDPAVTAQEFMMQHNIPSHHYTEIVEFIKQAVPDAGRQESLAKRQKERVFIDGDIYDFALEVTLEDGREVKLGYNAGEDYDVAAERFVKKHNVHPKMIPHLSALLKTQFPVLPASSAEGGNPLTGTNRYTPDNLHGNNPLRPVSDLYPIRSTIYFEKYPVVVEKAIDKLVSFNGQQEEGLKLHPDELLALETMFRQGDPDGDTLIRALQKGMEWPLQFKLPIVDLFRLSILRLDVNTFFFSPEKETLNAIRAILLTSEEQNVIITVCRILCNAFKHPDGHKAMITDIQNWIKILVGTVMRLWPKAQQIASCVLANYAFCLSSYAGKCDNVGPREDALFSILIETNHALEGISDSQDGTFKIDEAAGTNILKCVISLLWGDKELIKTAKQNGICNLAKNMLDCIAAEDGKTAAREILYMVESV